jgi:hypothetical protein
MPQFARCVLFEWGWAFFAGLAISFLVVLALLLFLAWFFGLSGHARGVDQVLYDKFGVRGPIVRWVGVIVVIGAIGYGLYLSYDKTRSSFEVRFDTATGPPVDLDTLRDKFQSDTQVTITIRNPAKKFLVSGRFEGACAEDLFESICRHYTGKLTCDSSILNQSLAVDMR